MGSYKRIALVIIGVLAIILGVLLGKNIIPKMIKKTVMERKCVNSNEHSSYATFKGNASDRPDNVQFKIYHWNLTNREDFLYNGALPQFKEVGPYVYTFGTEKLDIRFTAETVQYKGIVQSQFSASLTAQMCPHCNENDMFTNINLGYMGVLGVTGGEKNFAYALVPSITDMILAKFTKGNRSMTYQKIGQFNESVLSDSVPLLGNFKMGFSDFLMANDANATASSVNYTEAEMRGLYNVVSNATLLGVTGGSGPPGCAENASRPDCLKMGFLLLADWMSVRSAEVVATGNNPNVDAIVQDLFNAIARLFCPAAQPSTMCFDVTVDARRISLVVGYVTGHLAKLAVELSVHDEENYGVLTVRSHKEIAKGYLLEKLKLPGYENGIPVPGFVPNDADRAKASQDKVYMEHYKCGVNGKTEFSWEKLDNSESISSAYFPNATKEFLNINSKHTVAYFGAKATLDVCKSHQEAEQDSYLVYDDVIKSKYRIRKQDGTLYKDIPVHEYDVDLNQLYSVNHMSVFTRGLVDLTKTKNGIPFLVSAPHYMTADPDLPDRLGMQPDSKKHKSTMKIEPITGSTLELVSRLQWNTFLQSSAVDAPRIRPYNITYLESDPIAPTNLFPILWMETHVAANSKDLEVFAKIFEAMKGSCAALIIGPSVGILCLLIAGYLFWKKSKSGTVAVDVSDNFGKSSTSI